MSSFFVSELDVVSVDVFATDEGGVMSFYTDAASVKVDVVPETLKFVFRKPNYDDSRYIMSRSTKISGVGTPEIDITNFQDSSFRRLLKEWSLKIDDGSVVPITDENIGKMHPELVRTVVTELMNKVKI